MKFYLAWNEDISKCENFEDLPQAAKLCRVMVRSICEVAYGEKLKIEVLPKLLFSVLGQILDK